MLTWLIVEVIESLPQQTAPDAHVEAVGILTFFNHLQVVLAQQYLQKKFRQAVVPGGLLDRLGRVVLAAVSRVLGR